MKIYLCYWSIYMQIVPRDEDPDPLIFGPTDPDPVLFSHPDPYIAKYITLKSGETMSVQQQLRFWGLFRGFNIFWIFKKLIFLLYFIIY